MPAGHLVAALPLASARRDGHPRRKCHVARGEGAPHPGHHSRPADDVSAYAGSERAVEREHHERHRHQQALRYNISPTGGRDGSMNCVRNATAVQVMRHGPARSESVVLEEA